MTLPLRSHSLDSLSEVLSDRFFVFLDFLDLLEEALAA